MSQNQMRKKETSKGDVPEMSFTVRFTFAHQACKGNQIEKGNQTEEEIRNE